MFSDMIGPAWVYCDIDPQVEHLLNDGNFPCANPRVPDAEAEVDAAD